MCWSATASFVTLGIGTLFNTASYAALRSWGSPTSLLVWSWQYALLMQIPEGIVWLQIDAGRRDLSLWSRVAMLLNITQPFALLIGIRAGGMYSEFRHAYAVMLLYVVAMVSQLDVIWPLSATIAPSEGCAHLDLRYWNTSRGLIYVTTSLLVISEARPVFWAVVNASIFTVSLLLAIVVYPCGVGSVWCWFIFVAGPVLVLSDRVYRGFERRATRDAAPKAIPAPSSTRSHRNAQWRRATI